ncbi:(2Fe-2S)-binding protein [Pseudomaricurvus alkylphenolicus]|uniref:2Fe-2S iron-sulfur cluster-binding protein n=1 Tax=Pseudomaricurvus alkylphenolicus TaxID=1306991 RepID=UPI001420BE1C|nr:2Fe-2S iron-sulfur cluster-binding protein [Pseudomaricurvus alkylphenolicus]NIB41776.1 (2Fe-2S)-binding protein [Pseudomaricurvus alkylphenolicus]
MPKVTYLLPDGSEHEFSLSVGQSIMEGAVSNGIEQVLAQCGGSAMCATCHCYVEGGPVEALPPISDLENAMLDETEAERKDNSRLSCQVRVTEELSGLRVAIPEEI